MYTFSAYLDRMDDGYKHHFVPIPPEIVADIKGKGARRVIATVNGVTLKRALNSRKDGPTFLILGQQYIKQIGVTIGDRVDVQMEIDAEPDAVELVEEFQAVLDTDEEAAALFAEFTPGMQRSLNVHVAQAKQTDTRIKRALELAEKIRTKSLHHQRKKD